MRPIAELHGVATFNTVYVTSTELELVRSARGSHHRFITPMQVATWGLLTESMVLL